MSLVEEFKQKHEEDGSSYNITHPDIAKELGATQVSYDIIDETRWGIIVEYVYQRDDEYVSVSHEVENENGDPEYYPNFVAVKPQQVTVTKYVPV